MGFSVRFAGCLRGTPSVSMPKSFSCQQFNQETWTYPWEPQALKGLARFGMSGHGAFRAPHCEVVRI